MFQTALTVPETGIEPVRLHQPQDFKSCVSTYSTTRAPYLRSKPNAAYKKRYRTNRYLSSSGKRDSNSRPRPWQGRALPTELFPHYLSASIAMQRYALLLKSPNLLLYFLVFG